MDSWTIVSSMIAIAIFGTFIIILEFYNRIDKWLRGIKKNE